MFLKRVIVWYGMICYAMLWCGMESMICYDISMLCYDITMPCYVLVYVEKDKYSATVHIGYQCIKYGIQYIDKFQIFVPKGQVNFSDHL